MITLVNPDKLNIVSSLADMSYNYNTFRNNEYNQTITGTDADDFVNNDASNVKIITGTGNDIVDSWWDNTGVTIDLGDGNDSTCCWSVNLSSLKGGAGNDTIYNWSGNRPRRLWR